MNNTIKMVEIRDHATLIAAYAIKMVPTYEKERFLMKNAGYGFSNPYIMLVPIQAPWLSARHSEEHENCPRTLPMAHKYIEENFDKIEPGDVIDVEFILGEVDVPCKSAQEEMEAEMEDELEKHFKKIIVNYCEYDKCYVRNSKHYHIDEHTVTFSGPCEIENRNSNS